MGGLLDVARSGYVGLPPGIRRYLGLALRSVPTEYRYGSTYHDRRAAIVLARSDPRLAARARDDSVVELLTTALRAPYYRDLFVRLFGPQMRIGDIPRPENWRRIPILHGRTVRGHASRMCTVPESRLDRVSTSGSSGQPLSFFLDRDRSPIEYAFVMDVWGRAGCGLDDWRAWFRGWSFPRAGSNPFEVEHGLRQLRLSVYNMRPEHMSRYADEIERRGIRFLQGYPHALAKFAGFLTRNDHPLRHAVAGVMLHSEPFYPEYRSAVERAFPNATLLPFYGLSEKCVFGAPTQDASDVYEMNPLYGLTELVDHDGEPVTEPGRMGRIVSTGLQFTGMPFIRYDTGDEAHLVEAASEENGYLLRVTGIVPREGHQLLVTRSRQFIPTQMLVMGDAGMQAISEFQYEQDTPGEVRMRLVLAEGASPSMIHSYVQSANERMGGELVVIPEIVPLIPLSSRGKRRLLLQHLDVSQAVVQGTTPAPAIG